MSRPRNPKSPQKLTTNLLLAAYAHGIFPMSDSAEDPAIYWVEPRLRGVMPLDGFHISRSLRKVLRRGDYSVTLNADFDGVVAGCAARANTWINAPIRAAYRDLFARGHAHSLEVWAAPGEDPRPGPIGNFGVDSVDPDAPRLVGGIYGVSLGGAFFGESMFSTRREASKIAIAYLVDWLCKSGFQLFDTQFQTAHLKSLGAVEIPQAAYLERLKGALVVNAVPAQEHLAPDGITLLDRHLKR